VKKKILLGIVAAVLFVGLVGAAIVYNFGFRQRFEVVSAAQIRIFLGEGQTQELQQGQTLTWDPITSTSPQHKTLYIENTGTVDATLQLNYNQGEMPQGWTLTWDYDGSPVAQSTTVTVTMTLTLPSDIGAGTYECGSGITATPVP
jgi:hypothetical protein